MQLALPSEAQAISSNLIYVRLPTQPNWWLDFEARFCRFGMPLYNYKDSCAFLKKVFMSRNPYKLILSKWTNSLPTSFWNFSVQRSF